MTLSEFIADVKAKAETVETELVNFFAAHPQIEADATQAANQAVTALKNAASAEVTALAPSLPPEAVSALDAAILAAQQAGQAQIADIQADTDAKVAKLQAAKGVQA